jgi:hypothetical protein
VRFAWVFSGREKGVTGAGHQKKTAQKTARFVGKRKNKVFFE